MPVVCCSLHSQVAPVCAALAAYGSRTSSCPAGRCPSAAVGRRARAQTRGLIGRGRRRRVRRRGRGSASRSSSALAWAKAQGFDVAVCAIGPGIVGTGTALGHGGLAAAEAANAASALGGRPVRRSAGLRGGRARASPRPLAPHRRRCCGSASAKWSSPSDGAGWREACAGAAALATWVAARTTTLRSSQPRSRRAGSRESCWHAASDSRAPSTTGSSSTSRVEEWDGREREIVEHPGAVVHRRRRPRGVRHARPAAPRGDRRRAARDPGGNARARRGAARDRAPRARRRRPA